MGEPRVLGLAIGFVVLGLFFWALETWCRSTRAPIWFRRRDFRTDLAYWFFTPLVSRGFTTVVVGLAVLCWLTAAGDPPLSHTVAPFISLYAILIHANLPWDYGPLRYVLASPRFHRWHHTSEAEGRDKNFAGLFPFLDLLFGSFYMPRGRVPVEFGAGDEPVPTGIWRQIAYPLRKPRLGEALAADVR
jgi:sterol desaturase/sphingolipid hydroxylase (fatty acid hydroxylase superfamily)